MGQLLLTASGEYIDPAAFFEDDEDLDDYAAATMTSPDGAGRGGGGQCYGCVWKVWAMGGQLHVGAWL